MISRLRGKLIDCDLTEATLDVNGVGYGVTLPLSTFDQLPATGEDMELLVHTYVREDCIQLFGFATANERKLFKLLLNTSGVGPKLALNILSSIPVETFAHYIIDGDIKALSRVNGLGKRSAEKLIVELREKISDALPEAALGATGVGDSGKLDAAANDAIAALQTLGFKAEQARKAVLNVMEKTEKTGSNSENLIRLALANLNS